MRLLKCLPDGSFDLTFFDDDHVPRYAVLSHTWNGDQEVTYDELMNGTGKKKDGYSKIRFCGERSTADGIEYFWVDTCCINKSLSEEMTTAINSMYRWYQRAVKCYVYLSDVSVPHEVHNAQCFPVSWQLAFQCSRWFTRGWTLQELLAPPSVEFYSRDGKQLGNRVSLEREIHEITGIPIEALRGKIAKYSVNERMSWVAKRTTTRKEDKIYCLLGIFEVFLPLIYGEGEKNAAGRLEEVIQKQEHRKREAKFSGMLNTPSHGSSTLSYEQIVGSAPEDIGSDKLDELKCTNCGDYGHLWKYCPGVYCYNCDGFGHIKADCTRRNTRCTRCRIWGHHASTCYVT